MVYSVPVFSASDARKKRGNHAEEMLSCPKCEKITGVFVNQKCKYEGTGTNTKKQLFHFMVWERWTCLNCGHIWTEKYGVNTKKKTFIKRN